MRSTSTASAAERPRLGWLALAALLLSCARPPTRLVFRVLAENLVPAWCGPAGSPATAACPAGAYRLDSVLVRVCHGPCSQPEANDCVGDELLCRTYVDGPASSPANVLPGDITVAPADPDVASRVGVVVVAVARVPGAPGDQPTAERIRRRFVVPFVRESVQLVEVWLSSLCIGAVCPPETTCGRRSCEPVDNPTTAPFTPLPDAGPADGGDPDVSFSVMPRDAGVDAPDAPDVPRPIDVPDVPDVPVPIDAPDVPDVPGPIDAPDVPGPIDAPDVVDAARDAGGPVDAGDAGDGAPVDDRRPGCPVCLVRDSMCCEGQCIDVGSDPNNCGACGLVCAPGLLCCSGACTLVQSNHDHCGACGNMCGRNVECCGRVCMDTQVDRANCGGCGMVCPTRQMCCEGACTDVGVDAGRCGPAGT